MRQVKFGPKGRVRVVERRGTLELRVDDTYASVLRPGQVTTGSVWDALALPILALPPAHRRRVLILGLGAGSAARLVRALAPRAEIVGVELDRDVLAAARAHFGLDELGVEIVCEDARAFLARTRSRFDVILDDVFVGCGDAVRKPDGYPEPGLGAAWRRLATGGLLVANTIDEAPAMRAALRRRARSCVGIRVEDYDNEILVGTTRKLDARSLRAATRAEPLLAGTLAALRFVTR